MYLLLIILLILIIVGAPVGPWSGVHSWGWYPSGGLGLVLVILLVLLLLGRI